MERLLPLRADCYAYYLPDFTIVKLVRRLPNDHPTTINGRPCLLRQGRHGAWWELDRPVRWENSYPIGLKLPYTVESKLIRIDEGDVDTSTIDVVSDVLDSVI